MARRGNWLKLRGNVWWFQMAVPTVAQSTIGKKVIQENLRTSDRKLAERLALDRAAHWRREFDLARGVSIEATPLQDIFLEVRQKVEWIKRKVHDPEEREVQLEALWNTYAEPEAQRLGLIDLTEGNPEDVRPEVAAALEAIKAAMSGRKDIPEEFREPFSKLAARYIEDRQRDETNKLAEQTVVQAESVYRLFRDHIDDAPLATIDSKSVTAFFDKVKLLKPNWGRSPATKSKTLNELLKAYTGKIGNRLTNKTLNRYVTSLTGLWEWAEKRGEVSGKNPFAGQWTKAKANKEANAPWSDEALKTMLALADDPGTEGNPSPLYWLPRIALLSGMRLSKIIAPASDDQGEPRYVTPTVGPRGWNDYDRKCLLGIGAQVLFFLIATVALFAR